MQWSFGDIENAKHYYELAVMGGNIFARHNLGVLENKAGNLDGAQRLDMIIL